MLYFDKKAKVRACIQGGPLAPEIKGVVNFFDVPGGTKICVILTGLPPYRPAGNGERSYWPTRFSYP